MNYAVRITLPFDDCRDVVSKWADRSAQVIVYQHDADEEVSKTHIHIGLYGCEVKAEALKRMWADAPGKGNEFWSWKEASVEADKYLTYMSKGILRPVFVKNFSNDLVEKSRQSWVEPVKADKTGDSSDRVINKIMSKFDIKSDRGIYRRSDDVLEFGHCKYNLELLLTNVRSVAFRTLWGERRMAPHASHYKIIASTAFLRICEDADCFEQGSRVIQNLWY